MNGFMCRLLVRMIKQAGELLSCIILYVNQYATKIITIIINQLTALLYGVIALILLNDIFNNNLNK